jgi:glycosyltransferase involved in cell wall biosynthesis
MRIAQVAPLHESVPPSTYGGTERVVHHLTEALVAMGHDVTVYASGDSRTSARLVPVCPRSLRREQSCQDRLVHHVVLLDMLAQDRMRYDVIHFHVDYLHFALSRQLRLPQLTTLHGRLDMPELVPLFDWFRDMPVVSISSAQRRPLPHASWLGTVPHGLPLGSLPPGDGGGDYFAFLGRISPEKRVDRAIEIAEALGVPLRIAAKVDAADETYFRTKIEPLLDHPLITYVGEISEAEKATFLGNARALLFPIDWPEPFGLVMIEAMACGTPVVAFAHGSVPEVIDDGVTGFIVDDMAAAITAAARVDRLDRRRIRATFERRFSATRMAKDYVALYERVAASQRRIVIEPARRQPARPTIPGGSPA